MIMLFADSEVFGTFKGFNERGLEFAADIVAPYNASMLERPQLGQFLLVELGSPEEAALGRITRFIPTGLLTTPEGEDYVNTMQRRKQDVPEDLKEQRLKYRVQIKLLGAVRMNGKDVMYVPSQRRLPHLGAKVAIPSAKVLDALCKLSGGLTELGDYVLGEFIYSGVKNQLKDPLFRSIDPKLPVMFDIHNLISRRSVVFARAGYGKSNLIKFLVAELYRQPPKTENGQDVGTLIFDPDGEYFWPDRVRGRPGLCDTPQLRDKLVVFTNRPVPNPYYGSWKAGEVKLDIRDLPARDVIGIAVSSERQEQQNVLKLKALSSSNWRALVDLIQTKELQASDKEVGKLLGYPENQIQNSAAEIAAARSNMYGVVRTLHDPNSLVLSGTLAALQRGGVVVIDISLLNSGAGNMLAGLVLRRIFSHNQENFTGGAPIIPTIMILEEAQSVLGRNLQDGSPFVEWVKEGRKYDLGAILVTQQPGSMASELLSQADNWFCFHLLSEGDAGTLGKYNSHFSDDILAHLIGEPIRGNCYMWSAPHQPFVLPVRIRNFEELYGGNIEKTPDAPSLQKTMAREIMEQVSQAPGRLAVALIEYLKPQGGRNVKYVSIPNAFPNNIAGIGVYSGQLFHIIDEIKEATDVTQVNELKTLLFDRIFGAGNWTIAKQPATNKEYFCARREDWRRVLGQDPLPHPPT
jgi:DNA helicase HerA-like ATPase